MSLFNISEGKFKAIVRKGFSLDVLFVLEQVKNGVDVVSSYKEGRINSLLKTLCRRGYIDESSRLTESGEDLYNSILSLEEEVKVKKLENKDDEWEVFLSYYPPNDTFTWNGRSFEGSRGIKKSTKDGRELFTKAINNGYTGEGIWRAVIAEAIAKMRLSSRNGQNEMKYFINTESYLRQKKYLNFIEQGQDLTEEDIKQYKEAFKRKKKSVQKKNIDI